METPISMDDSGVPWIGNLQKLNMGEMTPFIDEFPSYKANMALEIWMLNMMINMRYLWDTMICYNLIIYPVMENVYPPVVKHGNGNVPIYRCFSQLYTSIYRGFEILITGWYKVVPQFGIAEVGEHNSNFTRISGRSIELNHTKSIVPWFTKNIKKPTKFVERHLLGK